MRLDDLLRTLAEDARAPSLTVSHRLALAALLGVLASSLLVIGLAGTRLDWASAVLSIEVQVKIGVAALLVGTGFVATREALQPMALSRSTWALLTLPPLALVLAVTAELVTSPPEQWLVALRGTHPEMCVAMVPLLSAPALAGVLLVMRSGAPKSPGVAGALAGLTCGALGAGAYMLKCTDDAPLFVMAWYGLAVLLVAGIGALLGRRVLRW